MNKSDYTAANRLAWDQAAPVHARQKLAKLKENFSQPGYSYLDPIESAIRRKRNPERSASRAQEYKAKITLIEPMRNRQIPVIVTLIIILLIGCTNRYVITDELSEQLPPTSTISIGDVVDRLPYGMDPREKPTWEHMADFKAHLAEQINEEGIFSASVIGNNRSEYELSVVILLYEQGSGAFRLLIGGYAGNSTVSISLKLVNRSTGEIVFGGYFSGTVSNAFEKGEKVFESVAKDFAKALKKAVKKQSKD